MSDLMKLFLFPLALLAGVSAQADSPEETVTVTFLGQVTTVFECMASGQDHCHYLLTTSLCSESMPKPGQKQRVCHHSKLMSFELASGEKKTVSNLPADYQYCMKINEKPLLASCMSTPNSR